MDARGGKQTEDGGRVRRECDKLPTGAEAPKLCFRGSLI